MSSSRLARSVHFVAKDTICVFLFYYFIKMKSDNFIEKAELDS